MIFLHLRLEKIGCTVPGNQMVQLLSPGYLTLPGQAANIYIKIEIKAIMLIFMMKFCG